MIRRRGLVTLLFAGALVAPAVLAAQAAPAGATGKCKDGSFTTAATKRGACAKHGGLGEWMKDAKAKPAAKSWLKNLPA